jgi:threonine dehydrogenase-like Zn-dependent dehydrogenase
VGLCATACVKLFSPSKVIVVDPIENRREVAKKLGATHTLDPTQVDAVHEIKELTGGAPEDVLAAFRNRSGADVAIEAVGIKATFAAAFEAVRPGGNVSIVGVFEEAQELPMSTLCIKNIGATMGLVNVIHMSRLLKIIDAGLLDTTPLITHTMPLDEGVEAYELFEKRLDNVIKVALTP